MDAHEAGHKADDIIRGEVERQDKMWGIVNERADSSNGQLLAAGLSQAHALYWRRNGSLNSFDHPAPCYPPDWSGFRDYGSDVANLAVAAAFLRQEIKRLVAEGADTTRKSRDPVAQPYVGDQPNVQTP